MYLEFLRMDLFKSIGDSSVGIDLIVELGKAKCIHKHMQRTQFVGITKFSWSQLKKCMLELQHRTSVSRVTRDEVS